MAAIQRGFLWKKTCRSEGEPSGFQKTLETKVGKKLQLKINDNRASMLSVRWERSHTQVSLHRIFLDAPHDILDELAFYLRKKQRGLSPSLKAFIEESWHKLDYSHLLDQQNMETKGEVHDLAEIFDRVNKTYFDGKVELLITWYGTRGKRGRSQVTFGLYYDSMKLIKINRLLDTPDVPTYVVEFVVYHEILHHVSPSYVEQTGRRQVHSKEFKKLEKQFQAYAAAKQWIEEHHAEMFAN